MAISAANAPYLEPITSLGRGSANAIAWSPDGVTLAVGTSFGVDLYDAETYELTAAFDTGKPVNTLAYSPDGTRLAVGVDGSVQVWDTASGILQLTLSKDDGTVNTLTFSPDGTHLFSGGDGSTVNTWDMADGQLLDTFTESKSGIRALAVSGDGKLLLVVTEKTFSVYDLATRELLYPTVATDTEGIFSATAVFFSRDGQHFIMAGYEMNDLINMGSRNEPQTAIYEWDILTGKLIQRQLATRNGVYAASASPDRQWLLLGGEDGIHLWDAFTGKASLPLKDQLGNTSALAFSPNGFKLAAIQHSTEDGGGILSIWSFATQKIIHRFDEYTSFVADAAFSPDGLWAAVAGENNQVQVWDAANGKVIQHFEGGAPVALSSNGKTIAINESRIPERGAEEYVELRLRSVENTEILPKGMLSCSGRVTAAFSADSQQVIYSGGSCSLTIRELETGRVLTKLDDSLTVNEYSYLPEDSYTSLVLSADEQWVAVGDGYESEVWNLPGKNRLLSLEGVGKSLALSADGRLFAASTSGTIQVWDIAAQRQLFQFNTLLSQINSLAFSPDGQVLAVGGDPLEGETTNIELWDTWAGEPLARVEAQGGQVVRVQFSADGKRLFSASQLNVIQVWNTVHAPAPIAALRPTPTSLPTATPTATLAPGSSGAITQIAELGKGAVSPVYRSPDGKIIAYVQWNTLFLVDGDIFDTVSTIEIDGYWSTGSSITFSPNNKLLVVRMAYSTAIVDIEKRAVVDYLDDAYQLAFSPDSRWLIYQQGYDPGTSNIRIWGGEPKTWGEYAFTYLSDSAYHSSGGFSLSPDGRLVAAGTSDGLVYIWKLNNGERRFILEGHADVVQDVAFSPNGRWLASGSDDGTVRLWDVQTGKLARLITGFTQWIQGVEFSADGSQLHVSIYNQPDQVWELAAEQLQPYQSPPTAPDPFAILLHQQGYIEENSYTQAQFSPDGGMLAVADGNILLWDVASQTVLQTLENPYRNAIRHLAFSTDAARITAIDYDGNLLAWDTHNGELVFSQAIGASVYTSAFSEDARFLASKTDDDQVVIWDTTNGKPLQELTVPREWESYISGLSFSADNTRLYVVMINVSAQVWDWQSAALLNQFSLSEDPRCYVESIHRQHLVRKCSYEEYDSYELWDLETQNNFQLDNYSQTFYFSPDGQLLVSLDYGKFSLWDTQTGQQLQAIETSFETYQDFYHISISPDNSTLATSNDGKAQLWDIRPVASLLEQRSSMPLVEPHMASWPSPTPSPATPAPTDTPVPITITEAARFGGGTLDDVIWSAAGQQIVAAGSTGITQYTATLTETARIASDTWVSSIASLPDGRILAAGVSGERVMVWDTADGQILADLAGSEDSQLALSPDGTLLVYGVPNDDWLTYDLIAGQRVAQLHGWNYGKPVFSPDGQWVAMGQGGYVRVWDARSGVIVNALGGTDDAIADLAFSNDGQYIVGAAGGSTWVWEAQTGAQLSRLTLYEGQIKDSGTIYAQTVTSVAISPDNALLAVGDSEKNIWLYERSTRRLLRQLTGHTNAIRRLRFSPDGTKLLSSDDDGGLMLWEVDSGKLLAANANHTGAIGGLAFRTDGNLAAWQGGTAWTIHSPDGALLHTTHIYSGTIFAASPLDDWLAVYYPYQISLWDTEGGEFGRMLPEEALKAEHEDYRLGSVERKFYGSTFSPDGKRLVTYASGGQWVYDLVNDSEVIFSAYAVDPSEATFSPDGQWLVTNVAPDDYSPIVYDLTTGENAWELSSYHYAALAFSPNQRWLGALAYYTTSYYGESQPPDSFELWDTATHKIAYEIPITNTTSLTSLAFNPTTTLAAVGQADGQIAVVDLTTFEIITTFEAHRGRVDHLAFSPDGLYLVSAGEDGTIRFWRVGDAH
jgi:WD40 repeat protein